MNFKTLFDLYKKSNNLGTVSNFHSIIKNYIDYMGPEMDAEQGLTSNKTKGFILQIGDHKVSRKYAAVFNLYTFYYDFIKQVKSFERIDFPITNQELPEEEKDNSRRKQVTFLSEKFDLNKFLDDEYYLHLKNDKVALMCKAAIGLAIATGYRGGYISPTSNNKTNTVLQLEDVKFENDKCIVPNIYKEGQHIYIDGKIKRILEEYIIKREEIDIKKSGQKNDFIAELEKTSRFEYDPEVYNKKRKPYGRHSLINYMLKYICIQNDEDYITLDHIKDNVIYHSLIQSKGTSLIDVIGLFDIKESFVREAINHFQNELFNTNLTKPLYIMNPEATDTTEVSSEKTQLLKKLRDRDKKKVRYLKELYDYKCQVCNEQITLIDSVKYCEVHHIRPLGNEHLGPDETYNMLVVCPNHHVLFDLGIITIDPLNPEVLLHTDCQNPLNQHAIILKHELDMSSLRYTYANIFMK